MKFLIVNADDFGMCPSVNSGVARAYDQGIVTSASLMVRRPAAKHAVSLWRCRPSLSVGLHLDISEWIKDADGWRPLYQVVDPSDSRALEMEARQQLAAFRLLAGTDPTHLDSHQHVHREEPFAGVAARIASELGVPLRQQTAAIRYYGNFYGQSGDGWPFAEAITSNALRALIESLGEGVAEIGCHPATDTEVDSTYRFERVVELATLCDAKVASAVATAGVTLISFAEAGRQLGIKSKQADAQETGG